MINLEELFELEVKFEKEKIMAEAKISVVKEMIAKEQEKAKASEIAEEALAI